ncbi:MAG: hydrogen gas-evolving membrane-bound hydrogenase subunit E [Gaiellaceae bacterium]
MNRRVRLIVFGVSGAVFAALLVAAVVDLPAFGHYQGAYGNQLNREAVAERHTTNVVTAVVFDYRGFDTLGEEFILFASVVGVTLLLRRHKDSEDETHVLERAPDDATRSDAVRVGTLVAVPVVFLLGLWVVAFGLVTPGGGFQGGVILAGAIFLVFLGASFRAYYTLAPTPWLDFVEGAGAAGFTLLGTGALLAGASFLHNFMAPGVRGTLESGGSLPLLNWATALAVTGAMLLLFSEFLERYVAMSTRTLP